MIRKIALLILFVFSMVFLTGQETIVLQPGAEGKDALIWSFNPNSNYGSSPKFLCMAWTYSGGYHGYNRSLIDFDLSEIPPGQLITDARLSLYFVTLEPNQFGHTGDNNSYLQLITEPWEEHTVNWINSPSTTSEYQVELPQSLNSYQDYLNIDITRLIQKLYDEPDYFHGLMLRLAEESLYRCLLFASSDFEIQSMRPKLVVKYENSNALTANFTYDIEKFKVDLTNFSVNAEAWYWTFGDGNHSFQEHPTHYYAENGWYEVCLQVSNQYGTAMHCDSIYVCPQPEAQFVFESNGFVVNFTNNSINASSHYWDFGNNFYSSLIHPAYTYQTPGKYEVSLMVENDCGMDQITHVIEIGLEKPSFMLLYPNPIRRQLNIIPHEEGMLELKLFDMLGALVHQESRYVNKLIHELIWLYCASGAYTIKVKLNDYEGAMKLVVLDH